MKLFPSFKPYRTEYLLLFASFLFGLLFNEVNVAYIQQNNPDGLTAGNSVFNVDNYWYTSQAENLVNHGAFNIDINRPELAVRRTPVYPMFYAFFYWIFGEQNSYLVIKYFQLLLYSLGVLFMFKTANNLFENKKVGLYSAIVYGIHFPFIAYAYHTLPESILPFFMVFSMYLFSLLIVKGYSSKLAFILGFVLALTALTKPSVGIVIAFVLTFLLVVRFKKLILTYTFIAIGGLVVFAPWIIRNYRIQHELIIFEKFYGDPMDIGEATTAMRQFVSCWINPEQVHTTAFSNFLYEKDRKFVDDFVGLFPQKVFALQSKDKITNLFYRLQDCQKSKFLDGKDAITNCDEQLTSEFNALSDNYAKSMFFDYYILTPIHNLKYLIFQSNTYPVAMLNPVESKPISVIALKAFSYFVWLLMIASVLYAFFLKQFKNVKSFLLAMLVVFILLFLLFFYYLRIYEIRHFIVVIPFLSVTSGLMLTSLYNKFKH